MLKNIFGTVVAKIITSGLSFILVVLSTQYLGAEGRGEISIVTASVGLIGLLTGFIGGSPLVYLFPRNRNRAFLKQIIVIVAGWTIVSAIICSFVMFGLNIISLSNLKYVLAWGILSSMTASGSLLLVGDGRITQYNLTSLIHVLFSILFFGSIILFFKNWVTADAYLVSATLASILVMSLVFFYLRDMHNTIPLSEMKPAWFDTARKIGKYGFVAQAGNLIQYFNYRLSFFVLGAHFGQAEVGLYSIGVFISEGMLLISSSLALVQYSRIVNMQNDHDHAVRFTVRLAKMSLLVILILLFGLFLLPTVWLTLIFGKDFSNVDKVILSQSIGIASFGFASIISHYFAGIGKYHLNTFAAIVGFLVTIIGNYSLTVSYGYFGAGMTASLSYLVSTVFLFIAFQKTTKIRMLSFLPQKEDIVLFKQLLMKRNAIG